MDRPQPDITDLLEARDRGEPQALDQVFDRVYDELRRRAKRERARFGNRGTLNTTGLVHEVYLKLSATEADLGVNRDHFLALAARAMRLMLVDHARGHARIKRGGDQRRTERDPDQLAADGDCEQVLAVHEALDRLATVDARLVQIVECRYFAGLSTEETGEAIGLSKRTVIRGWRAAQAFLSKELEPGAVG